MLSTQSTYNTDLEFYRRSERGYSLSVGQNSSRSDQYDTNSSRSRRTSPASEVEGKTNAVARKRVPVACDRCRKRKIKCSGDEGGGRGCSNCRNAGYGACRFLRVASMETDFNGLRSLVTSRGGWHNPGRYLPYTIPSQRIGYTPPPPTSLMDQGHLTYWSNVGDPDYGSYLAANQNIQWTKQASYPTSYVGYDQEASPHFSTPPSYMLPNTDPMMSDRHYCLTSHVGKIQPNHAWAEQASPVSLSSINHPVSNSAFSTVNSESNDFYHALSIGSGTGISTDRILPSPTAVRSSHSTPISTLESLTRSAGSHRSSIGWQTDTASSTSQVSCNSKYSTGTHESADVSPNFYGEPNTSYGPMTLNPDSHSDILRTTDTHKVKESNVLKPVLDYRDARLDASPCQVVQQDIHQILSSDFTAPRHGRKNVTGYRRNRIRYAVDGQSSQYGDGIAHPSSISEANQNNNTLDLLSHQIGANEDVITTGVSSSY